MQGKIKKRREEFKMIEKTLSDKLYSNEKDVDAAHTDEIHPSRGRKEHTGGDYRPGNNQGKRRRSQHD